MSGFPHDFWLVAGMQPLDGEKSISSPAQRVKPGLDRVGPTGSGRQALRVGRPAEIQAAVRASDVFQVIGQAEQPKKLERTGAR